jgi:hypothetical protein
VIVAPVLIGLLAGAAVAALVAVLTGSAFLAIFVGWLAAVAAFVLFALFTTPGEDQ